LFLSMPMGEINTDLILQHCVQNGKVCTIYNSSALCSLIFLK